MKKVIGASILPTILFVAAILRLLGTYPGFHPNHSDENFLYSNAIEMFRHGTIEPFRYEYPSLTPIINLVLFNVFFIPAMWMKFFIMNVGNIIDGLIKLPLSPDDYRRIFQLEIIGNRDVHTIFWSRAITALFGVGVVYLSYAVAKKMFSKSVGLFTAVLVCVNYRQVLNSHFALPDIYNSFFLLLGFFMVLYIQDKKKISTYLLTGVVFGAAISTKYQPFSFIPLLVVHLQNFRKFPIVKICIVFMVALLTFAVLNPYFFINIERALADISYASVKYAAGRNILDFYSYAYLFKLGIGPITSLMVIGGVVFGLIRKTKEVLLLLSLLVPFFYFWTYYSSGGFYTRNFVSISPFLLIFAALSISFLIGLRKRIFYIVTMILMSILIWENLSKSLVVLHEYTKPWNTTITAEYVRRNIPSTAKISAHSSVPLLDTQIRLPYEIDEDYSLDEFVLSGAEYAITNLDWASVDFYWWMRQPTAKSIEYWDKPIYLMKDMYRALSLRELQQFVIFSEVNSYLAPDSDFIVTKLPRYSVTKKGNVAHVFELKDWQNSTSDDSTFTNTGNVLTLKKTTPENPSSHLASSRIDIVNWQGFVIDYEIKNENGAKREGFLYTKFYDEHGNEVGIRLSSRNEEYDRWVKKSLVGTVPHNAVKMQIFFQANNFLEADISLRNVVVYNASVNADFGGARVYQLNLDESNVFPNSHGNL